MTTWQTIAHPPRMMATPTRKVVMRAGMAKERCVKVYSTRAARKRGIERKKPPIATPRITVTRRRNDVEPGDPAHKEFA